MAFRILVDKITTCRGKDIAYVQLIDDKTGSIVDTADLEYTGIEEEFTAAIKSRFKKRIEELGVTESTRASAQAIADKVNILE
jgi:cysteinyl-tRNA synthetase